MVKCNGPKCNGPKCNGKGKGKRTTRKIKGDEGDTKTVCVIHAAWCGHCQELMDPAGDGKSIWKEAKTLIGDKCQVKEYEESTDKEKIEALQKEKGVTVNGYPTIFKIDKNEKVTYFTGDRTADEIYNFAVGSEQKGGKRKGRKVSPRTKKTWWFW